MKKLKAIVLAAGKNVRMKSSTLKILHLLCGKPIIQYVLKLVQTLGIKETYIVLGHQNDIVRRTIAKSVKVVHQKRLLGTADAIKQTLPYLRGYKDDILVLCGDAPLLTKATTRKLINTHKKTKAVCTVLTAIVEDPDGYGRVVRNLKGEVLSIREEKDATPGEKQIKEINTGAYCFRSQTLASAVKEIKINKKKKEFYLTDIVKLLVEQKQDVRAVRAIDAKEGLGINTREDLAQAARIMRRRILKKLMREGVNVIDPETTYVDENVKIGKDTTVYPCTVIENNVRIGRKCSIGPFSHIRPNSYIGDNVHVGNFTEVSRTKVGNHCFMQHFSFLGDAQVGSRVNIGAGAVTANFDGKNKNVTKIADDAFIGSGSKLIAPVTIGKKAIIGAGCVVKRRQNIPSGSVAVGVPAKIISRRKTK